MPMNSLATSAMGAHSKLLRERSSVEVVSQDRIIARQYERDLDDVLEAHVHAEDV